MGRQTVNKYKIRKGDKYCNCDKKKTQRGYAHKHRYRKSCTHRLTTTHTHIVSRSSNTHTSRHTNANLGNHLFSPAVALSHKGSPHDRALTGNTTCTHCHQPSHSPMATSIHTVTHPISSLCLEIRPSPDHMKLLDGGGGGVYWG